MDMRKVFGGKIYWHPDKKKSKGDTRVWYTFGLIPLAMSLHIKFKSDPWMFFFTFFCFRENDNKNLIFHVDKNFDFYVWTSPEKNILSCLISIGYQAAVYYCGNLGWVFSIFFCASVDTLINVAWHLPVTGIESNVCFNVNYGHIRWDPR